MGKKSFFAIRESDKHFLLALLVVAGVVFFWRGMWGVIDLIPIVNIPFVSLFIGLVIMTFSGVIYREFMPEETSTPLVDLINDVFKKEDKVRKVHVIKYYDEIAHKHREITHAKINKIEHDFLITERDGEEFFIPIHRVREISAEGKLIWKKAK